MAKEEHVSIKISKNAALVLEELAELTDYSLERLCDEAIILYYQRTIYYYREIREYQNNKKEKEDLERS